MEDNKAKELEDRVKVLEGFLKEVLGKDGGWGLFDYEQKVDEQVEFERKVLKYLGLGN